MIKRGEEAGKNHDDSDLDGEGAELIGGLDTDTNSSDVNSGIAAKSQLLCDKNILELYLLLA